MEASEIFVPSSVIAGPPIERVVPSTRTAVLPNGVNVSPPAVSALLLKLLEPAVARAIVDVPAIREPALLIEYVVPSTVMAGNPGRSVEWPISKPPAVPGRAVNVSEPIGSNDVVAVGVETGKLEVPATRKDDPRE